MEEDSILAYAQIIVEINHHQVDKLFDYAIPQPLINQVQPGIRVKVPFANRIIQGFVMGLTDTTPHENLKDIIEVLDQQPVITEDLVELVKWISEEYCCQQVQVLKGLLPEKVKNFKQNQEKKYIVIEDRQLLELEMEKLKNKAPVQYRILAHLKTKEIAQSAQQLRLALGEVQASLKTLVEKGLVNSFQEISDENPYRGIYFPTSQPFQPNQEQERAIKEICTGIDSNKSTSFLLHGITGSGKTEIYLQTIANALIHNKDSIVLVPEISLTPQTVSRFKERFGEQVAVFHSRLTANEKLDQWWKIRTGQVRLVIGARSAIFAPFKNLGLIIIDEEHETSYKQEESPRYHARDVALKRGQLCNCTVVLGTATPSLETYYNTVEKKQHKLLTLSNRAKGNLLPEVTIVDLRDELRRGNRGIFSKVLHNSILDKIAKREQIILFLNRRGHSTFVSCRECGYVAQCPNCAVSLTLHSVENHLKCHYCDYVQPNPIKCPGCGSGSIRHFGLGTQRAEEEVKKEFPHARVLRMDVDTTKGKGGHQRILDLFRQGRADILIGTQMIAKGLDFPRVTLVGVLAADLSLNLPDFRACERTFQLIAQVAGRAGRDDLPGKVIIQTYSPSNYAIRYAKDHDYWGFYHHEISFRRQFAYPPYTELIRVVGAGQDQELVEKHIKGFYHALSLKIAELELKEGQVIGPLPAPISKIKNYYRWHLLIKGNKAPLLSWLKKKSDDYYLKVKEVKLTIDVNPLSIL